MLQATPPLALLTCAALTLTACNTDTNPGHDRAGQDPPGRQTTATLQITGTDELAFDPAQLTADAGQITLELTAEPGVRHTFVVEEANGDHTVVQAPAGTTATGSLTLPAGTYTFYCDVPGHRTAGMEGTLTLDG